MTAPIPLAADQLYRRCDPDQFSFDTTAELEDLAEIIGQGRALDALHFGIGIAREGYNLYVLGPAGVGKHTVVSQYLQQRATASPVPPDWVYVNNFGREHQPVALRLPSGHGPRLRDDVAHLVEDLRSAIPVAFETEQYHARLQEIEEQFKARREEAFGALAKEAESHNITLIRTPGGFAFAPMKKGEVLGPDEFEKLPEAERKRVEEIVAVLQEKLSAVFRQMPQWQREARDMVKEVNREVAMYAVEHIIDDVKKKYAEQPAVVAHLDAMQQDVITNVGDFLSQEESTGVIGQPAPEPPAFRRYHVNVLVDNADLEGAPVVYEDTPMYQNLVGRVEHQAQMGALVTDFTLIKPGALHRANGGYLMLDVRKVLLQPYAWEGLKRALQSRELRIQSLGQIFSLVSTVSLEPEPVPLDLKVVLMGDRMLYYLLLAYDPDFGELFKVAADFEEHIERTGENDQLYARLIATLGRKEDLLPLRREAVARVIEHAARQVEDAERLSIHMESAVDLLREADHWARERDQTSVEAEDVQRAIDAQIRRSDRLRERLHEEIQRGTLLIDTDGEHVGQVNGLTVIDLGNYRFGQPTRITATARLGEGKFVDIEREVKMGGPIHSKGVMILSSFLASRYSRTRPLSLSASLVFEQSYGMVEGDSASVGELCALLSVLAEAPVRQSLAVTGSVNQHGVVQPIGGVNEKIEGFFDVCRTRGLSGEQGVVIPASNVKHLMLRQDVVEAAAAGRFHIFAVETVDQAVELLTGVSAGERDAEGNYLEGSINQRADEFLAELAEYRHEFIKPASKGESDDD